LHSTTSNRGPASGLPGPLESRGSASSWEGRRFEPVDNPSSGESPAARAVRLQPRRPLPPLQGEGWSGETRLFIRPGFEFQVVDAMVTNFHLPESTLLMLVCAFAGRERVLAAYAHAVRERYRFFSYGDAMLVTPTSHPARVLS
jgi:hypothetical protein